MTDTSAKKDTQKLQRAIVDALEDVKAQEIVVFDTEHMSPLFERVIIASGTSNRQTKALAAASALVWRLEVPDAMMTRSNKGDMCSVSNTTISCAFTSSNASTMAR